MIYEYALDPELLISWRSIEATRLLAQSCGLGTPRIISCYPSKKRIKAMFKEALKNTRLDPMEEHRIVELLNYLLETVTQRSLSTGYNKGLTWLANAQTEHSEAPFKAILSVNNKKNHRQTLIPQDIGDPNKKLWSVPNGEAVQREPAFMRQKLSPILRCSHRIIFVDPYFRPSKRAYKATIQLYLKEVSKAPKLSKKTTIEFHTVQKNHREAQTIERFFEECQNDLASLIPTGLSVKVLRWKEKPRSEVIHNRYLLTDLGGVSLGNSFNVGEPGSTDDISVLSYEQYLKRWKQYVDSPAFENVGKPFPLEIDGIA